jgi:hypothetical protein
MKQIGSVAVFLSLVCFMFIAGGVEHLQPNPSINDIVSLIGASAVALAMGLLGISIINEGESRER